MEVMDMLQDPQRKESFPPFQDIRKPTMKETYQYVVKLAKEEGRRNFQNVERIVSLSTSLPLFDESLRLMVIDILQIRNEVVRILLSQNDNQIKRIMQCKWFFFNLSSDLCIDKLFPHVSVSVRCKIINQLSKYLKSNEEAERYFLHIKNKYGSGRAEYLLPRCSNEFIWNYFEKFKPTFNGNSGKRSLMKICQRYPLTGFNIISAIFEMKKNQSYELGQYKNFLLYLGGHYPDELANFLRKHHSYMPPRFFGKKLTKKIGLRLKDLMIPDYLRNEIILNRNTMFLIFSFKEQVEFLATLVRRPKMDLSFDLWQKANYTLCEFLKLVPPRERMEMVQMVFHKVFNEDFDDHTVCWTYQLLETMPTDCRQPYLRKIEELFDGETSESEINIDKSFSHSIEHREEFYQLLDCSTGFKKFHGLLKKSPPTSARERILTAMVKNCEINNDIEALRKVVEFVALRHRNDEQQVIYSFINAICNSFRPERLTLQIYETIEDLIYFLRVKGLIDDYVYYRWVEKHIYYRLEHNMDVDNLVGKLFELLLPQPTQLYARDYKSKHAKTLILALWDKARAWILSNTSEECKKKADNLVMNMVLTCRDYKLWSKQKRIFFGEAPGLQDLLKKKLAEHFHDVGGENWPVEIWDRYFEQVTSPMSKPQSFYFTLQKKTKVIVDHFRNVLNILFEGYCKSFNVFFLAFMRAISFYGHTGEVVEIILNEFKSGDSLHKRKNALNMYSYVCTIEEFTKVVEDYIPKEKKVERFDNAFDEIQMFVPKLIMNVRPRYRNFDLIVKFMFGDFLKSSLLSFRACCYHTRCDEVLPLLKERLKAVPPKISYQKDLIKLLVEISDEEERSPLLKRFWKEFEDSSVRGFLLKAISHAFLEHPSRETFEVLEECIIDCDTSVINSRPSNNEIPGEFFSDYVSALWQFSAKTKPRFKKNLRQSIIWNLKGDRIQLVKPAFSESIIRETLFNASSDLNVNYFTVDYIHADPLLAKERLDFVMDLLKERKPSASIFKDFTVALTTDVSRNAVLFDAVLQNWPDYPEGVVFEIRELISLHSLHHGLANGTPEKLAKELTRVFSNIEGLNDLLGIYTKIFGDFLLHVGTLKAVRTVREMVLNSPNTTIAILGVCSLPGEAAKLYEAKIIADEEKSETKKILNEIAQILESRGDKVLGIYRWWKLGYVKP